MNVLEYLAIAYAVFTLMIVAEMLVSWIRKDGVYRFGETFANLAHGVAYQTLEFFTRPLVVLPGVFLASLIPWELPTRAIWAWVLGFVTYDFFGYWSHRLSHELNFWWGSHAAHHASEDFNLAAALRQPLFQSLVSWPFMLPVALLGVPGEMLVILAVNNFLYQFWIHTRYIGRLGPLDWFLNTPSNHRVHHGRESKYLDKNHGQILIVWDRLFGTYQAEEEEPGYGLTEPLGSWNTYWGNWFWWAKIYREMNATPRLADKVRIWFAPPTWVADGAERAPAPKPWAMSGERRLRPEDVEIPAAWTHYVRAQAVLVIPVLPLLIYLGPSWSTAAQLSVGAFVFVAVLGCGGLLERKWWAPAIEGARGLFGVAVFASLFPSYTAVFAAIGLVQCSYVALGTARAALKDGPASS